MKESVPTIKVPPQLNLQESITQASNLFSSLNKYKVLITLIDPKCQNMYFSFSIHHLS